MKAVILLGILLVIPGVMAQGVAPGITPESPLYELDLAVDTIRMNFGGGETRVSVMEERMAEVQLMTQKGLESERDMALQYHTRTRMRIQSEMERGQFNSTELETIEKGLQRAETQLTQLKKSTPDEAQEGLNTALEQIQTQQRQVNETKEQVEEAEQ